MRFLLELPSKTKFGAAARRGRAGILLPMKSSPPSQRDNRSVRDAATIAGVRRSPDDSGCQRHSFSDDVMRIRNCSALS